MNKLKLDLDALQVDSFEAEAGDAERPGTVHGRQVTRWNTCNQSCGCPVTDLAHTCTCPDSSVQNACFCTEWQSCWCENA
ncbi:MAG TPA: hypothetical protein VF541_05025 [Longimicrobium sp.]|jgi:hypothetical protein